MNPVVPEVYCSDCKMELGIQSYVFQQMKRKVKYRISIHPHQCRAVRTIMPGKGFDPSGKTPPSIARSELSVDIKEIPL